MTNVALNDLQRLEEKKKYYNTNNKHCDNLVIFITHCLKYILQQINTIKVAKKLRKIVKYNNNTFSINTYTLIKL